MELYKHKVDIIFISKHYILANCLKCDNEWDIYKHEIEGTLLRWPFRWRPSSKNKKDILWCKISDAEYKMRELLK